MSNDIIEYVVPAPIDFESERQRVHEYLSRDLAYEWIPTRKRAWCPGPPPALSCAERQVGKSPQPDVWHSRTR